MPFENPQPQKDTTLEQYEKELNLLDSSIMQIEAYINARNHIDEVQARFDKMNGGSVHVNHAIFRETGTTLNRYRLIIDSFEKDHHVPLEGGIEAQEALLNELKTKRDHIIEFQAQLAGTSQKYKQN